MTEPAAQIFDNLPTVRGTALSSLGRARYRRMAAETMYLMNHQFLAWLVLAASVLAEVLGTLALRHVDGFTKLLPSTAVVLCYGSAIKHLEMGPAYAVWAGSGTALTAVLGIIWFGESFGPLRMAGLGCIVLGVIALNLSSR